jgi:hypothetical protein
MRTLLALGIVLASVPAFAGNPGYRPYGAGYGGWNTGARAFGGQPQGPRFYGSPAGQSYWSQQSTVGPFTTTRTYGSRGYSSTSTETDFGTGQRSFRWNDNRGHSGSGSSTDFGNGLQTYRFHDNRGHSWSGSSFNANQMGSGFHYRAPYGRNW